MSMESSKSLVEQTPGHFPYLLIYAILEWIMILMLFIDGLLAFISNEFAKFFGLRIPCLLCTRIDHVLVHTNSSFYYNESICEVHKKDISCLAYCLKHKRLSDIRTMCQGCLISFSGEKDSDCDRYKSIVGILHKDIDRFVEDERKSFMKQLKKEDTEFFDEKSAIPWCSCCGESVKLRSSAKYLRNLSLKSPAPSPRVSWLGKNEDPRCMESPRFRYTELKLISETDSEVPHEDASNIDNQGREDTKAKASSWLQDPEDLNEDAIRTPLCNRGNKYFGVQFDPTQESPRWLNRSFKKQVIDKGYSFMEPNDICQESPRWLNRSFKKHQVDKGYPLMEPNDICQESPRWLNRSFKKHQVDKGYPLMEPHDISPVNELDGDILNNLKKQVRLDHKSLMAMYMELDKERSAAAVAANNAMAMITRIQAEKAAVQMEALQYQRMMEEQAEYDQEALQDMMDLLFKKDEVIKALESELEAYREKYGYIKKVGSDICEVDADEDLAEIKAQFLSSSSEKSDQDSLDGDDQKEIEHPFECMPLDFEGEKSCLLGLLTDLEKKVKADEGSNCSDVGRTEHEDEDEDEDEDRGKENKAKLTREVSLIKERLRVIEADTGFLKQAAMTMQRGDEGAKILTEIAQHLRKLRRTAKTPSCDTDA